MLELLLSLAAVRCIWGIFLVAYKSYKALEVKFKQLDIVFSYPHRIAISLIAALIGSVFYVPIFMLISYFPIVGAILLVIDAPTFIYSVSSFNNFVTKDLK